MKWSWVFVAFLAGLTFDVDWYISPPEFKGAVLKIENRLVDVGVIVAWLGFSREYKPLDWDIYKTDRDFNPPARRRIKC